MQNKDKDEGLEVSPLDMLLVTLLGRTSMAPCVVKPSSSSPWREFDHKFLYPTSKSKRSHIKLTTYVVARR